MRTVVLAALLLLAASAAAAQQPRMLTEQDLQNVKPESCPAADSLAGHPLAKPKHAAQGWRQGDLHNIVSDDPFSHTAGRPVEGIMLNAIYRGEGTRPPASFALQLRLRDSVLRTGPETNFTLILDSVEVPVGRMAANSTPYSYGHTIDQVLTTGVGLQTVLWLVTAHEVRGRIGTWEFTVPDRTVETFHAVFIAAICGAHLR